MRKRVGTTIVRFIKQQIAEVKKFIDWLQLSPADKRWHKTYKNALKQFDQKKINKEQAWIKSVLKSEMNFLKMQATSGAGFATPMSEAIFGIAVKMCHKLIPMAQVMGIQPMEGPVGLGYRMVWSQTEEGRLRLEVIKEAIEAKSRALQVGWTFEAQQDLIAAHGLDMVGALTEAIAAEAVHEIYSEMIGKMSELASTRNFVDGSISFDPPPGDNIMLSIQKTANNIARLTRRGVGNFVITSPVGVSLLQCADTAEFVPTLRSKFVGPMELLHVGTVNERMEVYCSLTVPHDEFIVGYTGTSQIDQGLIYHPYVLLMTSGVVIDPATFEPKMKMMTRYGGPDFKSSEKYPVCSGDYFGVVKIRQPETTTVSVPESVEVTIVDQPQAED